MQIYNTKNEVFGLRSGRTRDVIPPNLLSHLRALSQPSGGSLFENDLERDGAHKLQEEISISSVQDIDALVTTLVLLMALLFSLSLLMFKIALIPPQKIWCPYITANRLC